jgi:hypothetical protein
MVDFVTAIATATQAVKLVNHLRTRQLNADGEDPLWDREKSSFLYIQQVEFGFMRREKAKVAAPPPKRGLFR